MYNQIQLAIIKVLIRSPLSYMTAQNIADNLHVSRRTVFNNLKGVQQICFENEANLISIKSKGYRIENPSKLIIFLKNQNHEYINANHQEYKLYILYLLISDETPLHISELESIMYLSRPTIYKLLDECSKWFEDYKIELVLSRKGIYLQTGEKRLRAAIKGWINETKHYYVSKDKDQTDYFKLKSCLKEFIICDFQTVVQAIDWICELNKIHLSRFELTNMAVLLEVIIYRIEQNHYAVISDRLFHIVSNFYTETKISCMLDYLKERICEKLTAREVVYFMASVLINADLEDRNLLSEKIQNIELNQTMINECESYLKQHLNIQDADFEALIEDIQYIVKNEVLLQIKGETGKGNKHYNSILKNYHSAVIIAKELYLIISKYYSTESYEKMICKIVFSILSATQKNKQNLKVAFYHDCDFFEFKYVLLCLQSFPFISLVYITDSQTKLEDYLQKNHSDLIISTVEYQSNDLPVLVISKVFGGVETAENIKEINKIYQAVNFKNIIKNIEI